MSASMTIENIADQTSHEIFEDAKIVSHPVISFAEFAGKKNLAGEVKSERALYYTIGQLSNAGYCFPPDEKAETIHEAMKHDHAITAFTIVEDKTAIGFMTRTALNETLGGRYGFELHSRNPIRKIMETDFLKVDFDMPVDQVSKLAMQRPFERLYNPIVVEHNGKYSGIVTVKDLLETSTKIAQAERDEITVMKDNLKIGIFFMDHNYTIQDHYSRHLEEVLSDKELAGKSFSDILSASVSEKELDAIRDYFEMLFENTMDEETLDDINPLQELHYVSVKTGDKKVFQCDFTIVEKSQGETFILVAIYDITAEVKLEQQLLEEENKRQEEMKTMFELLQVEPGVLNDFLDDAGYEFEQISETLKNESISAHKALVEVYQSVHAIKSNAVILGLKTFGEKAHTLESTIKKLREQKEVSSNAMLDLAADTEKLSLEKEGFKKTIENINSFRPASSTEGRNQSQYVLVESLTKTVNKASEDMGKNIKFIVEKIDNEAIENGPRRVMKEVLMQLIRNSVVHGIESPEERTAAKKDKTGVIKLSIEIVDGDIKINLGDDGRGLDYNKIAEKALRLNIIKQEEANDKSALLKAIFSPGFSTAETEGMHAGRGIGLNLVQDRLRAGNGFINKVKTENGKGTIFSIVFPKAKLARPA